MNRRDDHRLAVIKDHNGIDVTTRSTAEARWALFFSQLGFRWQYEPKKFKLSGGRTYTPDFLVDGFGWIEVKPTIKHIRESWAKIQALVKEHFSEKDRLWIFYDSSLPLKLDSVVMVNRKGLFRPTQSGLAYELIAKRSKKLSDIWGTVQIALNYASSFQVDHMVHIGSILSSVIDDIADSYTTPRKDE